MWPFQSYPEVNIDALRAKYDYIVVGGGTAGCVLANRLSADPSKTVLVVERGPIADSWVSHVPLLSSDFASDGSRTFKHDSTVQVATGKSYELFTGSVLGGSSRINQMLYTRGLPAEYDMWAEAGRKGWKWEDLKPYFMKGERCLDGAVEGVHNSGGVWSNRSMDRLYFPGFEKSMAAAEKVGLPLIEDLNSPNGPPFGCASMRWTIDENSHRNSTFHAFLPPTLAQERRRNLHICTNAIVEKINTERLPDGSVVTQGITLVSRYGERRKIVDSEKEVVLSAGPFGSPHVLLLSGIGPSKHLKEHDIAVVKDLPAVGSNLQDHFGVTVCWHIAMKESLLSLQVRPWVFIMELIRYLIWGTGLLLCPVLQMAIFAHSNLLDKTGLPTNTEKAFEKRVPDIEIMPMAYSSSEVTLPKTNGWYSMLNVLLRPRSKGTTRLSSSDPRDPLIVDTKYLSDKADYAPLRASIKLSLRLIEQMRAQGYAMDNCAVPEGEDDATLDAWIREWGRTTYHYSSTCRMAPEDDAEGGGVVDDELRVHGVHGLRVADSSALPWILGTHLQAPTVAIAEKCADMLLQSV